MAQWLTKTYTFLTFLLTFVMSLLGPIVALSTYETRIYMCSRDCRSWPWTICAVLCMLVVWVALAVFVQRWFRNRQARGTLPWSRSQRALTFLAWFASGAMLMCANFVVRELP